MRVHGEVGAAGRPEGACALETWRRGWGVLPALAPAAAAGAFHFGLPALAVMGGAAAGCVALQALGARVSGAAGAPLTAGRAVLTGLLLGMILPASAPSWLVLAGCVVVVVAGFGGRKLWFDPHPTAAALAALLLLFAGAATAWTEPVGLFGAASTPAALSPLAAVRADPAGALVGRVPGGSGATSVAALVLGWLFLAVRRAACWPVAAGFAGVLAAAAGAAGGADGAVAQLLCGDIAVAALFVAADPTAAPRSGRGRLVYGAGCGLLAWLVRTAWGRGEGVWFAVLLMNMGVPLIDRWLDGSGARGSSRAA